MDRKRGAPVIGWLLLAAAGAFAYSRRAQAPTVIGDATILQMTEIVPGALCDAAAPPGFSTTIAKGHDHNGSRLRLLEAGPGDTVVMHEVPPLGDWGRMEAPFSISVIDDSITDPMAPGAGQPHNHTWRVAPENVAQLLATGSTTLNFAGDRGWVLVEGPTVEWFEAGSGNDHTHALTLRCASMEA